MSAFKPGSLCCDNLSRTKYVNTTQVPQLGSSTLVDPYTLPAPQPCPCDGGPSPVCSGQYDWVTNTGGTCGSWVIAGAVPDNTFAASGTVDFPDGGIIGFKAVDAARSWHGRFGFLSNCLGYADTIVGCGDSAHMIFYQVSSLQAAPDQTKYLDMAFAVHKTDHEYYTPGGGGSGDLKDVSADFSSMSAIAPFTGLMTFSNGWTGDADLISGGMTGLWGLEGLTTGLLGVLEHFCGFVTVDPGGGVYTYFAEVTGGGTGAHGTVTIATGPKAGQVVEEWSVSIPGSFSLITRGQTADGFVEVLNTETLALSNTIWEWSLSSLVADEFEDDGVPAITEVTSQTVTITLSEENAANDILADLTTLQAEWPLNDDVLHPWRTDGNTGIGVLVTRNEVPGERSPFIPVTDGSAWTDPFAGQYDGSILGSPLSAGHQGFYDFRRENWMDCGPCDDSPSPPSITSYGAATPSYLPQNCTQWTEDIMPLPVGAGVYYNRLPKQNFANIPTRVYSRKWAEKLLPWKSVNFARPAGDDKFLIDETLVYQVASIVSGVVTLTDRVGDSVDLVAAGLSSGQIWGGASVDGFYALASISGSTVTLGTKRFSLPFQWSTPSGDTDTAFGKLRFPTAPGILGRVAVSSVTDGSPVTILLADAFNLGMDLVSAEGIDLCGADMTVLASNATVTCVSPGQFTVPTAYATIKDAKYAVSHGVDWTWDDDSSHGTYLMLDWTYDYRAYAEATRVNGFITACAGLNSGTCDCSPLGSSVTVPLGDVGTFHQSQGQLTSAPCAAAVVCVSNNEAEDDSWPNGRRYATPSVLLDAVYGTRMQMCPIQAVTDPFWQTPHQPPPMTVFQWLQDDGSCQANEADPTRIYYAHGPVVEGIKDLPTGAPSLPSGITLGFLSPVDYTTGDVIYAPDLGGQGPWVFMQNACDCINALGRFAGEYQKFMLCG